MPSYGDWVTSPDTDQSGDFTNGRTAKGNVGDYYTYDEYPAPSVWDGGDLEEFTSGHALGDPGPSAIANSDSQANTFVGVQRTLQHEYHEDTDTTVLTDTQEAGYKAVILDVGWLISHGLLQAYWPSAEMDDAGAIGWQYDKGDDTFATWIDATGWVEPDAEDWYDAGLGWDYIADPVQANLRWGGWVFSEYGGEDAWPDSHPGVFVADLVGGTTPTDIGGERPASQPTTWGTIRGTFDMPSWGQITGAASPGHVDLLADVPHSAFSSGVYLGAALPTWAQTSEMYPLSDADEFGFGETAYILGNVTTKARVVWFSPPYRLVFAGGIPPLRQMQLSTGVETGGPPVRHDQHQPSPPLRHMQNGLYN